MRWNTDLYQKAYVSVIPAIILFVLDQATCFLGHTPII